MELRTRTDPPRDRRKIKEVEPRYPVEDPVSDMLSCQFACARERKSLDGTVAKHVDCVLWMRGAHASLNDFREAKLEEAIDFLESIKARQGVLAFNEFLAIMKEFQKGLPTSEVYRRATVLFAGDTELFAGFVQFLPKKHEKTWEHGIPTNAASRKVHDDAQAAASALLARRRRNSTKTAAALYDAVAGSLPLEEPMHGAGPESTPGSAPMTPSCPLGPPPAAGSAVEQAVRFSAGCVVPISKEPGAPPSSRPMQSAVASSEPPKPSALGMHVSPVRGPNTPFPTHPPRPMAKVEQALDFLMLVKQCTSKSEYSTFIQIMTSFKAKKINTTEVYARISTLWTHYPYLRSNFHSFLPKDFGEVQVIPQPLPLPPPPPPPPPLPPPPPPPQRWEGSQSGCLPTPPALWAPPAAPAEPALWRPPMPHAPWSVATMPPPVVGNRIEDKASGGYWSNGFWIDGRGKDVHGPKPKPHYKRIVPISELPRLVRLVHGSTAGLEVMTDWFLNEMPRGQSWPSKAQVMGQIRTLAQYKRFPGSSSSDPSCGYCWQVDPAKLVSAGIEMELPEIGDRRLSGAEIGDRRLSGAEIGDRRLSGADLRAADPGDTPLPTPSSSASTQVGYAAMPKGSTSMTEGGRQPAGIQRINAEHARHGMPPDKPPSKFALGTRRKAADGDEWEVRRMDGTRTPDEPLTNP